MKRLVIWVVLLSTTMGLYAQRWSEEKVNKWYKKQGWLVGANFAPSSAINQLEMWQADTFDPEAIDRELAWAEDLGFNTMRVFLHNLLWEQDKEGFIDRVEQYLKIADKHGIKTMLVLLDDVWHPYPKLGKQPDPKPHVHNSGWVQSPGHDVLIDEKKCDALEGYIKGVVKHFKKDKRVIIWDIYNEPGNTNGSSYGKMEPKNKGKYSLALLKKVYKWVREVNPSQPICVDVWTSIHKELDQMSAIDQFAYNNSDVINFHCYSGPEATEKMVKRLAQSNRPLICTEYMARKTGSTFQNILPIFKKYNVAAYNWGFVSGKSQTIYPWDSWHKQYQGEPELWFHDIFRKNGQAYIQEEVDYIKQMLK
ncbi:1,4-beta-xylanase [Puteibacter caeruleilacunae]|nr:1,4-beta-xylanase [Puteibacter caeruleilacunae]